MRVAWGGRVPQGLYISPIRLGMPEDRAQVFPISLFLLFPSNAALISFFQDIWVFFLEALG